MGIREYRPTSPGVRFATVNTFEEITTDEPERSLVKILPKHAGRSSSGRIAVRHRGGGWRRKYRIIDFKRDKDNIPAKVATIEYDPNRSAFIALLHYADGEKRYILAPVGLKVGQTVISGENIEPEVGNCMPLRNIPTGIDIHNIELYPGRGGQLVRSAGGAAKILSKEGDYVTITLPSREVRLIRADCRATIGQVGNLDHDSIVIGKAGRKRWMGIRPTVRGTAQAPVDHPMGGGEGRRGGGRHPCSPTGKLAKGGKTRNPRALSNKYIIRRRKK